MSAARKLVRFVGGGLLGASLGGAVAVLFAPDSGDDLRRRLRERLHQARVAGAEAQAAKTEELIRRFRGTVDDPVALTESQTKARQKAALAISALSPSVESGAPAAG